jgi:transcriptional regulator with XRE-family HTH domain
MYARLIRDFRKQHPSIPNSSTIELGLAVKHIRLRMGMSQQELARDAKIKLSALKSLENSYGKFTTGTNLAAISRVLRTPVSEIIEEGREWFLGNFFILRSAPASPKDASGDEFRPFSKKNVYEGVTADIRTPALASTSHFCAGRLEFEPGKALNECKLPFPHEVSGFVKRGSLRIVYDEAGEFDLFANQSFTLRADKPHKFVNPDSENPLILWLLFPSFHRHMRRHDDKPQTAPSISIGRAVKQIRKLYSPSDDKPLALSSLAPMTGLERKQLEYLEKTTQESSVIYWDKLERISEALRLPITEIIAHAHGRDRGFVHLTTARDRALIDYRHYHGLRLKSILGPGANRAYHFAEMELEPKKGIHRLSWKRKDPAKILVMVEDGELNVEVGKNRKMHLKPDDSLYFDGGQGYLFNNAGTKPCKALIATFPAIIY